MKKIPAKLKPLVERQGKKLIGNIMQAVKDTHGVDRVNGMAAYHKHGGLPEYFERKARAEPIIEEIYQLNPDLKGKLLFKTEGELRKILLELKQCRSLKT